MSNTAPAWPQAERLRPLLTHLAQGLIERDTAARLVLLAALAGEHVLLLGPPGTAKSELARRLRRCLDGAPYFERLLTRFSTPEELFGPLSLKALEEDRYERLVQGYLPTAGVAFLDEVFKANSAILNALLTLLNEREFDNGAGRSLTPLVSVIGASNEGPVDEGLQAFFDRFLLRVPVQRVSDEGFLQLLQLPVAASAGEGPRALSAAERQALVDAASAVALGDDVLAALLAHRRWLDEQGLTVSDRRWRQLLRLLQVQAASEGRTAVDRIDLWLLPAVVAADTGQVPQVATWVAEVLLGVVRDEAPGLHRAVEAFERQLSLEERAEADDTDDSAGKLSLARALGPGDPDEEGGMTRLMSEALAAQRRKRYSPVHVAARRAQLDEVLAGARERLQVAVQSHEQLMQQLAGRLWCPPSLQQSWLAVLAANRAGLAACVARAEATRAGFAALPLDAQATGPLPQPLTLA